MEQTRRVRLFSTSGDIALTSRYTPFGVTLLKPMALATSPMVTSAVCNRCRYRIALRRQWTVL